MHSSHEKFLKRRACYALAEVVTNPNYKTIYIFGGRDTFDKDVPNLNDVFSFKVISQETLFWTLHLFECTGIENILGRNII